MLIVSSSSIACFCLSFLLNVQGNLLVFGWTQDQNTAKTRSRCRFLFSQNQRLKWYRFRLTVGWSSVGRELGDRLVTGDPGRDGRSETQMRAAGFWIARCGMKNPHGDTAM